jgi:hypothetical protein
MNIIRPLVGWRHVHPSALAEQWTLVEAGLFRAIPVQELLNEVRA